LPPPLLYERKAAARFDDLLARTVLWNFGGAALHDHRAFSVSERSATFSSNRAISAQPNSALSVGEQRSTNTTPIRFWRADGIELPGEIGGLIRRRSVDKISITRIPMGHEVGVA